MVAIDFPARECVAALRLYEKRVLFSINITPLAKCFDEDDFKSELCNVSSAITGNIKLNVSGNTARDLFVTIAKKSTVFAKVSHLSPITRHSIPLTFCMTAALLFLMHNDSACSQSSHITKRTLALHSTIKKTTETTIHKLTIALKVQSFHKGNRNINL